jgi:hypothetical protein
LDDLEPAKHIFRIIQQNFYEKFVNINGSQTSTLTKFLLDELTNSTSQYVTFRTRSNEPHSLNVFAHQNHPYMKDTHRAHKVMSDPKGQPLDLQLSYEAEDLLHMESEFHGGMRGSQTDLSKLQVHEIYPRVSVMCTRLYKESPLDRFEQAIRGASSDRPEPFISIIFIIPKGEDLNSGRYRLALFHIGHVICRV